MGEWRWLPTKLTWIINCQDLSKEKPTRQAEWHLHFKANDVFVCSFSARASHRPSALSQTPINITWAQSSQSMWGFDGLWWGFPELSWNLRCPPHRKSRQTRQRETHPSCNINPGQAKSSGLCETEPWTHPCLFPASQGHQGPELSLPAEGSKCMVNGGLPGS